MKTITSLLAEAYRLSERNANRSGAVELLRDAFAKSPELHDAAKAEKQRLDGIVKARSLRACYITALNHSLLQDSLVDK